MVLGATHSLYEIGYPKNAGCQSWQRHLTTTGLAGEIRILIRFHKVTISIYCRKWSNSSRIARRPCLRREIKADRTRRQGCVQCLTQQERIKVVFQVKVITPAGKIDVWILYSWRIPGRPQMIKNKIIKRRTIMLNVNETLFKSLWTVLIWCIFLRFEAI